jgi:hypothetical protein
MRRDRTYSNGVIIDIQARACSMFQACELFELEEPIHWGGGDVRLVPTFTPYSDASFRLMTDSGFTMSDGTVSFEGNAFEVGMYCYNNTGISKVEVMYEFGYGKENNSNLEKFYKKKPRDLYNPSPTIGLSPDNIVQAINIYNLPDYISLSKVDFRFHFAIHDTNSSGEFVFTNGSDGKTLRYKILSSKMEENNQMICARLYGLKDCGSIVVKQPLNMWTHKHDINNSYIDGFMAHDYFFIRNHAGYHRSAFVLPLSHKVAKGTEVKAFQVVDAEEFPIPENQYRFIDDKVIVHMEDYKDAICNRYEDEKKVSRIIVRYMRKPTHEDLE